MAGHALRMQSLDRDGFLAQEQASGERHEIIEGVADAMVGGSEAHNLVAMNLAALLHGARPERCPVFQ